MKAINFNDKSLSGSTVLVRGTHFLSKQIILHMKLYALMTGRKPLPYSHAETLIWDPVACQMYTCGARAGGTEISRASDYYTGQGILIKKPKVELSDKETWKLWEFAMKVKESKYQKGNFLAWITYLKTGWFLSKKGNQKLYCYELAARFSDFIGRWPEGKSLDMVSVYDLFENPLYEECKP